MDWKEAAGVIVGGVALLLPAIKWLISDWAKKSEQLEVLRARNTDKSLDRLEEDVKDFRASIAKINATIEDLSKSLTINRNDIIQLKERLDEAKRIIEGHSKNMEGNIRNMIKTELVAISKEATLIRDKKNGT